MAKLTEEILKVDRKKKIYIQYAAIFILIMVFGVINFLFKTSDIWRSKEPRYEYETISSKDLLNLMNQNKELIIVDARGTEDFKNGHLKGAVNLPFTSLKNMDRALNKDKGKEIVIYCENGERSKKISDILSNLGFSKIRNLDGGVYAWITSGGEIVK